MTLVKSCSIVTVGKSAAEAAAAAEVMMMFDAGALVARRFAREFHWNQPAGVHQRIDRAVDGRDAEGRHLLPTGFEHFGGPQRTGRDLEYLPDRIALFRVAFHRSNMPGDRVACRAGAALISRT